MRRNPRVLVQFVGNNGLLNLPPEAIVSVTTNKSLAAPAGSFEIVLKSGGLGPDGRRFTTYDSSRSMNEDYWMAALRPMMVVTISMGSEEDLRIVQSTVENRLGRDAIAPYLVMESLPDKKTKDAVLRSVVMVGIVDEITQQMAVSVEAPQHTIRIRGRDFSKILLDDVVRRLVGPQDNLRQGLSSAQLLTIGRADEDAVEQLVNRTMVNSVDRYWDPSAKQGAQSKLPLADVMTKMLNRAPGIATKLDNGLSIRDYFQRVEVSDDLSKFTVRATLALFLANGPLWELMAMQAPRPLAEVFCDTVGLENVLIVRRPPFFRPLSMAGMKETVTAMLRELSYDDTTSSRVLALLDDKTDAFTSVKNRVTSENYHEVNSDDVVVYSATRSGATAYSQYQCVPSIYMAGGAADDLLQTGVAGAYLYDLAAATRFGTRLMQAVSPWSLPDEEPAGFKTTADIGGSGLLMPTAPKAIVVSEKALSTAETARMYYNFRDSAEYLMGGLVIRGRPEIRIGDRVRLPHNNDTIVYVESVQQSYTTGRPFVTNISFSRGQPFTDEKRVVSYDEEAPTLRSRYVFTEDKP